jgi:hypothetical protein
MNPLLFENDNHGQNVAGRSEMGALANPGTVIMDQFSLALANLWSLPGTASNTNMNNKFANNVFSLFLMYAVSSTRGIWQWPRHTFHHQINH